MCSECGHTQAEHDRKHGGGGGGGGGGQMPMWQKAAAALAAIGILGGGAYALLRPQPDLPIAQSPGPSVTPTSGGSTPTSSVSPPTTPPADSGQLVSKGASAANQDRMSQGERILFTNLTSPEKQGGQQAFAAQNWDEAAAQYNQAATQDRNDPESVIYEQNARARKAGIPLTIAAVVPVTPAPEIAQEILRGIAQYQRVYNNRPDDPTRLIEIAIVDSATPAIVPSLAQDLIKSPQVLGVLGHGLDASSQAAFQAYQSAGVPVLSPGITGIKPDPSGTKFNVKVVGLEGATTTKETVVAQYIQSVGRSLAEYVFSKQGKSSVAVFYNSDNPYGSLLKTDFEAAWNQRQGTLVRLAIPGQVPQEEGIDIARPGFDAQLLVAEAKKQGAKTIFLALSRDKLPQALEIARANAIASNQLLLVGGDELYNPDTLVKGDAAINGLVLSVPWSPRPGDDFTEDSSTLWKGRVSWRTTTAFNAAQGLIAALKGNPTRRGALTALASGQVELTNLQFGPNPIGNIQLMRAVPATKSNNPAIGRPKGSNYQFDPL